MTAFDLFVGIDYSGAETPTTRLSGLRVFAARPGGAGSEKWSSPTASNNKMPVNWTRKEIAYALLEQAREGVCFLAGVDHAFSFPISYFKRYGLRTWDEFLKDFVKHWPTHQNDVYVDFVRDGTLHERRGGPPPGKRTGRTSEFRLTERWTSSAKSVFQFDVQGSVAKSTHAGIPWLKWLRDQVGDQVHFWPFDGWTPVKGKAVIVEVYPSIFRNRYGRGESTKDEHDAYAIARWMADMSDRGVLAGYFAPPLTDLERKTAEREGWIFGIR